MNHGGRFFVEDSYLCSPDNLSYSHFHRIAKMKLYDIVFSPTGTSAKIAHAVAAGIADFTTAEISHCDLTLGHASSFAAGRADLAVIAAPVYGGKMAPIAKERMKDIKADSTPCIVIAVYGNRAFENAVNDMAAFAESLGFVPVAAGAFVGEHSYSTAATPIAVGRPDGADWDAAFALGREVGVRLKEGTMKAVDASKLHDEPSPEQSVANFKAFVKSYMERRQAAPVRILPEVREDLCCDCGECVAVCPTGAIDPDSHAADAGKCIKCCACVKVCPEGARTLSSPFAPVLSENFSAYKTPQWILG